MAHMREGTSERAGGAAALTSTAVSPALCEEIAQMRRKLQRIDKRRVLFLDETQLRLSDAANHTLVLPGEQAFVEATDTSSYAARYDMIACCTGDRVLLPKIFTPKERVGADVRGINRAMLLQCIDDTLAQAVEGLDRYPLTLVLDRATIHKDVGAILQAFHDRGSQAISSILLMPPNAAKRLSPLDNSLFHDWKEAVRQLTPVTKRTIQRVMADAWNNISSRSVAAHYKHCGLLPSQDPYFDCPAPAIHQHSH
jgi:hypothetical protein